MIIRQGIAADYPQLLDIWLRAVRATHHFLQPSDIDALLPQLRDVYFPAVDLWVAEDTDDQPLGFIGLKTMWKCSSSTQRATARALAVHCWISAASHAVR